jgi:type I restriction enzyme S subunit
MYKLVRLGEIAEISTGFPFKGEKYSDQGTRVVRGENVTIGSLRWDAVKCWDEEFEHFDKYSLREKDVVIGMDGSRVGKNRAQISKSELPLLLAQRVACVRTNGKADQDFLYYLIRSNRFEEYVNRIQTGSSIPHISQQQIAEFQVPCPPIEIQKGIAQLLTSLDSKISINNRINCVLEGLAKTIHDYWFVQFDFPISKEQAKAMGKPRLESEHYKASGGKMVWSEELKTELPAIWKTESLTNIVRFNPTISLPKGTEASYIDMDALPQRGFMTKAPMKKAFNGGMKFQNGDVAVARITPCLENGKTGLITLLKDGEIGFGSTEFIILRGQKFDLRSYASCLARSAKFRAYAISKMTGTSGRKRVSASDLEMYVTAIPDDDTLKRFEQLVSPFFEKMTLNALENQKLAGLRDWLLPMLMNGQVRIKEAVQGKVIDTTKKKSDVKPESIYDYQSQIFALIADVSKQNRIKHGEMTIAKYAYLIDKLKGIPTFFDYGRHHLGPWAKEMKKVLLNKHNFKIDDEGISVVKRELLNGHPYEKQIKEAVLELTTIVLKYKSNERSHQTELLATVCKVVEDIKSTDLKQVRESMKKWPINLKGEKFKNKAEKFSESETNNIIALIRKKDWLKQLLPSP